MKHKPIPKDIKKTDPWVVNVKGSPGRSFEISVLRRSNTHGKESYGWFDADKLYVSGSGGPCGYKTCFLVFHSMVYVARCFAEHLNSGGSPKDKLEFPTTCLKQLQSPSP